MSPACIPYVEGPAHIRSSLSTTGINNSRRYCLKAATKGTAAAMMAAKVGPGSTRRKNYTVIK